MKDCGSVGLAACNSDGSHAPRGNPSQGAVRPATRSTASGAPTREHGLDHSRVRRKGSYKSSLVQTVPCACVGTRTRALCALRREASQAACPRRSMGAIVHAFAARACLLQRQPCTDCRCVGGPTLARSSCVFRQVAVYLRRQRPSRLQLSSGLKRTTKPFSFC